jgi:hypothetical protein
MAALDTSAEASMVRAALYRRMSADQRSELVVEMSLATRQIALENIRRRHPTYGDHEARMALYRLLLGDELFCRVWPDERLLAP